LGLRVRKGQRKPRSASSRSTPEGARNIKTGGNEAPINGNEDSTPGDSAPISGKVRPAGQPRGRGSEQGDDSKRGFEVPNGGTRSTAAVQAGKRATRSFRRQSRNCHRGKPIGRGFGRWKVRPQIIENSSSSRRAPTARKPPFPTLQADRTGSGPTSRISMIESRVSRG
jgi:hypothetical protein